MSDAKQSPEQGDAPMTRAELVELYQALQADVKALQTKGGADLAKLTVEEAAELAEMLDSRDDVKALLDEMPDPRNVAARVSQGDAYLNTPTRRPAYGNGAVKGTGTEQDVKADRIESGESEWEKAIDKGPFKSFGHFAYAIRQAGDRPGHNATGIIAEWRDRVLASDNAVKALFGDTKATPSGLGEFSDSDGGVLVPVQLAQGVWTRSLEDDFNFLNLVQPIPTSGNSLKVRAYDDKSRADGSRMGGVAGYWTAEAAQYTTSKPTFRTIDLKLNKLTVLVHATEELLEDAPGIEAEINRVAATEVRFKVNDAMFRGSGVGMPLGMLNAGCKIAAASNNGANTTISATDIDNMWRRRAKPSGQGYVWLANQDTEEQLSSLKYVSGSTPYAAIWRHVPGEPMQFSLKGRTLYYTEFNESLGTEGDIILVDPTQYAVAVKSTGIKSAVSMHLRFDYDETVFKFALRMDARPYWDRSLTRFKGSDALSPIITLETTRSS